MRRSQNNNIEFRLLETAGGTEAYTRECARPLNSSETGKCITLLYIRKASLVFQVKEEKRHGVFPISEHCTDIWKSMTTVYLRRSLLQFRGRWAPLQLTITATDFVFKPLLKLGVLYPPSIANINAPSLSFASMFETWKTKPTNEETRLHAELFFGFLKQPLPGGQTLVSERLLSALFWRGVLYHDVSCMTGLSRFLASLRPMQLLTCWPNKFQLKLRKSFTESKRFSRASRTVSRQDETTVYLIYRTRSCDLPIVTRNLVWSLDYQALCFIFIPEDFKSGYICLCARRKPQPQTPSAREPAPVLSCTFWTFRYSASRARCISKSAFRSFLILCCSISLNTPACMAWNALANENWSCRWRMA